MRANNAIAILVALLAGCGGGGGGGGPGNTSTLASPALQPPPPPPVAIPFASAISAFMQASHDYVLSATNGADSYRAELSFTPAAQTTFEGQVVSTMQDSGVIKKNGTTAAISIGTEFFDASPFKVWGFVGSDGVYGVNSNQQLLPSSATPGQSGPLDTITSYADSTKQTVLGSSTRFWVVEPDTATTAWGCINENVTPASAPAFGVGQCYKIDTAGNVLALKATYLLEGMLLTFQ
jgi:hypothetical protein